LSGNHPHTLPALDAVKNHRSLLPSRDSKGLIPSGNLIIKSKKDKNLWMFFAGCLLGYGSLICFAANFNFIIKVYGYTDLEIAINGVLMIVTGTVGASLFIIYIKKSTQSQNLS
jgi:hypothetical protein